MRTPEGRVKKEILKILKEVGPDCYYFMPVQSGYGQPTLDFLGSMRGKAFAIEAKAPGKSPTPRQLETIRRMEAAGVQVFVISGEVLEYNMLKGWLYGLLGGGVSSSGAAYAAAKPFP